VLGGHESLLKINELELLGRGENTSSLNYDGALIAAFDLQCIVLVIKIFFF
jgi:hypothetical protein